jgi:hypothetical protein
VSTFRFLHRRRVLYGYQMCPMLESRFWGVVGLRCDYPSDIARIVLERLCADYLRYRRTGSVDDKLAAWRAVRACHGWFGQLEGRCHGLS